MSNYVFVENLAEAVTTEDLRRLFGICGDVREVDQSEMPRGTARVEMGSADAAARSIVQLKGHLYKGRELEMGLARVVAAPLARVGGRPCSEGCEGGRRDVWYARDHDVPA